MNCSFCARDGVANAEAPNSAASAIPKRFPFIDSSIDTRKRLGAAHGSRISPLGWRKVQRPPAARLRFAAAGVLNVFRLHQRPWPPLALTFKLKMRKPREQLDGYRYWNSSTGGLVAIAVREGFAGFWDDENTGKKASTVACFVSLPSALVPSAGHAPFDLCRLAGALVAFAPHAPFKLLHQRFRFPQVRCVKAFCELLIDCLHQLQALCASTFTLPKARKITRGAQFPAARLL